MKSHHKHMKSVDAQSPSLFEYTFLLTIQVKENFKKEKEFV